VRFQPDKWAEFAAENGFKYLIFTTKHHDGFCMFDTKYSNYKITAPECPFSTHRDANVVERVFDAFREKGIAIAAYFSKPDWHCPWFWAEGMDVPVGLNHRTTYSPLKYPEIWEKFTEFTHNQIMELVENYGRIDILWLDGGQVNPAKGLDIKLDDVVKRARQIQPWMITADRTVGGEHENYITPEQCIPDKAIRVPWESCITVGRDWAYRYNDTYKSARTLVKILVQVVSRGGNLAINVGPQPDGRLPAEALKELSGLGAWLKVNCEAIYGTRACEITQVENVMYTKRGDTVYAIIPLEEGEFLEKSIFIPTDRKIENVVCLETGDTLKFKNTPNGVSVDLPCEIVGTDPYAIVFSLK
jgi:alpha-L-fucosidase